MKPERHTRPLGSNVKPNVTPSQEDTVKMIVETQKVIDKYNCEIFIKDEFFNDFKLTNNVIVRAFKEPYVKAIENGQVYCSFQTIDGRQRTSDVEKLIQSPFLYLPIGVIVALPKVNDNSVDENHLSKFNVKVGDVVYLDKIMWHQCMFYTNRTSQIVDYIKNQDNYTLANFEGYFTLNTYNQIQGYIDRETFIDKYLQSTVLSPLSHENGYDKEYVKKLLNEL